MDKRTIKETDLLERYILGDLTEVQEHEIEKILVQNEELRTYLANLEDSLEHLALENEIAPPSRIKDRLLHKIKQDSFRRKQSKYSKKNVQINYLSGIAAGLAFLFLISSAWLYNSWQNERKIVLNLQENTEALQDKINQLSVQFKTTQDWYKEINNPEVIQVQMKGNVLSPEAKATVYINPEERKVILNAKNLPPLAENLDYQVWADVEGEMINMGIVPDQAEMLYLSYIDKAESLNITIEPKGGKDHPTVSRLIANSYL